MSYQSVSLVLAIVKKMYRPKGWKKEQKQELGWRVSILPILYRLNLACMPAMYSYACAWVPTLPTHMHRGVFSLAL